MRTVINLICIIGFTIGGSGCQTTVDNVDAAIRKQLPIACELVEASNQAFLAIAAVHPLKASIVAAEKTAYDSAAEVCAHQESVTTMALVIRVTTAATVIAIQLREAEKAGG